MFNKMRENYIIHKIQRTMKNSSLLDFIELNTIKEDSACLLMQNKISADFYKKVFIGGDINHHWSQVNKNYILNYFKQSDCI